MTDILEGRFSGSLAATRLVTVFVCLASCVRDFRKSAQSLCIGVVSNYRAPLLFPAIHVNTIGAPLSLIWMRAICRSMELKWQNGFLAMPHICNTSHLAELTLSSNQSRELTWRSHQQTGHWRGTQRNQRDCTRKEGTRHQDGCTRVAPYQRHQYHSDGTRRIAPE